MSVISSLPFGLKLKSFYIKKLFLTLFVCIVTAGYVNSQSDKYDKISSYGSKGVYWALVQKENKNGFIDDKGKEVVPVKYDNPNNTPVKKYKKEYKAGLSKDNSSD